MQTVYASLTIHFMALIKSISIQEAPSGFEGDDIWFSLKEMAKQ